MRLPIRCLVFTLAIAMPLTAHAAGLRVACEAEDVGAEVFINGKFKGECPVDIDVPAGTIKIRVLKKIDKEYERVFEQEIRMTAGTAKKVEPVLLRGPSEFGKKRLQASFAELVSEANKGDAFAQWRLGHRYNEGKGVEKNRVEARKWWRKAAEQGYAFAQVELGWDADLSKRYGGLEDYKEAAKWLLMAAMQGDENGQADIGRMYEEGRGVKQDCFEAVKWYRKAASHGNHQGYIGLGRLYHKGCGVEKDSGEAAKWYQKGAENEDEITRGYIADMLDKLTKGVGP